MLSNTRKCLSRISKWSRLMAATLTTPTHPPIHTDVRTNIHSNSPLLHNHLDHVVFEIEHCGCCGIFSSRLWHTVFFILDDEKKEQTKNWALWSINLLLMIAFDTSQEVIYWIHVDVMKDIDVSAISWEFRISSSSQDFICIRLLIRKNGFTQSYRRSYNEFPFRFCSVSNVILGILCVFFSAQFLDSHQHTF